MGGPGPHPSHGDGTDTATSEKLPIGTILKLNVESESPSRYHNGVATHLPCGILTRDT